MSRVVTEINSGAIATEDLGTLVVDQNDFPGYLVYVAISLASADPGVMYVWANQPVVGMGGTLIGWNATVFNTDPTNTHYFTAFVISEV